MGKIKGMTLQKREYITGAVLFLIVVVLTCLYIFYDSTKIKRVQLTDLGYSSGINVEENLFYSALQDPERYSYGGCTEFPGGSASDYNSYQIYVKASSMRITDCRVEVTDFGAYADRWMYVDHSFGENPECTVTLYRGGLSDAEVYQALQELELNFSYVFHGTAKSLPFRITAEDIAQMK